MSQSSALSEGTITSDPINPGSTPKCASTTPFGMVDPPRIVDARSEFSHINRKNADLFSKGSEGSNNSYPACFTRH
ncbi:UNVERIFIED_CONTAM: hypothetical protein Sradi_3566700 [Sesamum radiatum]|uniref:Uncharacterized protein n=1 Tax=Sesamum radiatum TaxID=300843 RepID=A0AAW2QGK9_SESRA